MGETKIGALYHFRAIVQDYDRATPITVGVHALGETQAREELNRQGYTNVTLLSWEQ